MAQLGETLSGVFVGDWPMAKFLGVLLAALAACIKDNRTHGIS